MFGPYIEFFDKLDEDQSTLTLVFNRERSGSVVEYLTRDGRAAGSSPRASLRCGP